jgi:hypothetical protein
VTLGVAAVFILAMIGMSLPEKVLASVVCRLAFAAIQCVASLAADERPSIQV